MTEPAAPAPIVPVLCPRCRTEVVTITDGPGVGYEYVGEKGKRGGDLCAPCPGCGERVCVRISSPAARRAA